MSAPPQGLAEWMSFLANLVVFLGLVAAPFYLSAFLRERKRDREERERATFSAVGSSYMEYLRICLDHPELSCVEAGSVSNGISRSDRDQDILLQIVVSMLEEAYFLYRDHDSPLLIAQWNGWLAYTRDWCRHPEFRKRWPGLIQQYDQSFVDAVTKLYAELPESAADQQSAGTDIPPLQRVHGSVRA